MPQVPFPEPARVRRPSFQPQPARPERPGGGSWVHAFLLASQMGAFAGFFLAPAVALLTKVEYRPLAVLLSCLATALGLAAFLAAWGNHGSRKPVVTALSKFLLLLLMLGLVAGAVCFFLLGSRHAEPPGAVAATPAVEQAPLEAEAGPSRPPDAPVARTVGKSETGTSQPVAPASGNGPLGSR